jgi:hypothetical protein
MQIAGRNGNQVHDNTIDSKRRVEKVESAFHRLGTTAPPRQMSTND